MQKLPVVSPPKPKEWHNARLAGIGGSDIAAVVGIDPWRTPLDVFLEKTGQADPETEVNEAMHFGTILEDVVAREYQTRTGNKVQRINQALVHPDNPILIANIDRAVINPSIAGRVMVKDNRITTDRILECKTANGFAVKQWGDADDAIPDQYFLQCQWYLGITKAAYADVAVLIGGNDFRVYSIQRNDDLFSTLTDAATEFWQRVEANEPPPPVSIQDARKRWGQAKAETVYADADLTEAVSILNSISAQFKALKAEEERLKLIIMNQMKEAVELRTADGSYVLATWKTQVKNSVDTKLLKAQFPDIAAQVMRTSQTRVFLKKDA